MEGKPMGKESLLGKLRKEYKPKLPQILKDIALLELEKKGAVKKVNDSKLKEIFPKIFEQQIARFKKGAKKNYAPMKIGVVFSGGQAAGGHNVIAGIFDALKALNSKSTLIGFLNGPSGIIDCKYIEITEKLLSGYRNQGGFDLIGSGRTKIETEEQFKASKETANKLSLDGIVIIGGDDSNTNAALLSEYFLQNGCTTNVVGVPKTIDGDLKNEFILTSFGFDTACKVYSEIIGNIARDAISAKKYYHFIKLMGRSASHVTLECALQCCPNFTFIAEEVQKENKTLNQLATELTDFICKRAVEGKNYGVILIPEGLIEFIPEMKTLISELNLLFGKSPEVVEKLNAATDDKKKISYINSLLSNDCKKSFDSLPDKIKLQLLIDRDPHGNIQVSLIETEKLFIDKVNEELKKRALDKVKFNALSHFLGYEGRSCFPSNFDADYCYSLGFVAVSLLKEKLTGYICSLANLFDEAEKWLPLGVPLVSLMNMEVRKGKEKPVIKKSLVDLIGRPFKLFASNREKWKYSDEYSYVGPIQYFGDKALTDKISLTMELENS